MRVVRSRTAAELADDAADFLTGCLREKPGSVLALPTASTPLGLYAELARRAACGSPVFEHARVFNLDEFCGRPPEDPSSYLLEGDAVDLDRECVDYERALALAGGIDLDRAHARGGTCLLDEIETRRAFLRRATRSC